MSNNKHKTKKIKSIVDASHSTSEKIVRNYDIQPLNALDIVKLIIPKPDENDLIIFRLSTYESENVLDWKIFIDQLFSLNPNVLKWKMDMRDLMDATDVSQSPKRVPNVPTTFLELYILNITLTPSEHGINSAIALTIEQFAIVRYFLLKGANASINISQIIKYQSLGPTLYQIQPQQTYKLVGSLLKMLMQPCYHHQCKINFDVSFNDIIQCVDADLVELYLNTIAPNPQQLSLIDAIQCARKRQYIQIICDDDSDDYFGHSSTVCMYDRHVAVFEKLLNYGVLFDFDRFDFANGRRRKQKYELSRGMIIFLIEQRTKELNNKVHIVMQINSMRNIPKELIFDIVDMSLPEIEY